MATREEDRNFADALDFILDGEPLTRTHEVPAVRRNIAEQAAWLRDSGRSWAKIGQRLGIDPGTARMLVSLVGGDAGTGWVRSPDLIPRACALREEGLSFAQIAERLGIAQMTAIAYVQLGAPELRYVPEIAARGGRPPGAGCRLSDEQLRDLHSLGVSGAEVGRRLAARGTYPSEHAGKEAILRGWRRLRLTPPQGGCAARKRQHPNKGAPCRRPPLIGGRYCQMHSDPALASRHAAGMRAAA